MVRGFRVWYLAGAEIFLFTTTSRPVLGPIQSPVLWVTQAFPRIKHLVHDTDHPPPSSAKVKKAQSIMYILYIFWTKEVQVYLYYLYSIVCSKIFHAICVFSWSHSSAFLLGINSCSNWQYTVYKQFIGDLIFPSIGFVLLNVHVMNSFSVVWLWFQAVW
jgi:hypothetical protein